MQAGKLNQRIALDVPTATKGAAGGMQRGWTELDEVWASVRHFNGAERRSTGGGGGEVAVARTEFTIRYRSDVTALMRVRYKGQIYNIAHVNNWMERNERLVLTCDTGANDG